MPGTPAWLVGARRRARLRRSRGITIAGSPGQTKVLRAGAATPTIPSPLPLAAWISIRRDTAPRGDDIRRVKKIILIYGLLGGVLIAGLKLIEYRFLVAEHSVEIYGGVVAALFAAL